MSLIKKVKIIFAIIVAGVLLFYLSKQILLLYSLNDKKNIPIKRDLIEGMTQKREIINTVKDSKEKLFGDYYAKVSGPMDSKLREVCYRQIMNIAKNKPNCPLDELDVESLRELDKLYETAILGIIKTQEEIGKIEEKRLTTLSSPSPDKIGWLRYISQDKKYIVDYPADFMISTEGKDWVGLEKKARGTPQFVKNSIIFQEGFNFKWGRDKYDMLKTIQIGETIEKVGCKLSIDDFCTFTRLSDVFVDGKQMKVFVSEKIADFPNKIKLFLYVYEKGPGYMIGLETNEKSTNKTNITLSEFKDIISTVKFLE